MYSRGLDENLNCRPSQHAANPPMRNLLGWLRLGWLNIP